MVSVHRPRVGDRAQRARRRAVPRPRRPGRGRSRGIRGDAYGARIRARVGHARDRSRGRRARPARGLRARGRRARARSRLRPCRQRIGRRRRPAGRALDPGRQRPRRADAGAAHVHAQDGRRAGRQGPDRHAPAGAREPRGDRRRVRPDDRRRDGDRARPLPPRRPDRRDPRLGRAHQADRRRRHHGVGERRHPGDERPPGDRHRRGARRGSSPRPRCAAWGARSRGSCGP